METKLQNLSVEKRILLHLLKYSKAHEGSWEVPHALSQEGISEGLDILLNNVSRAMKALKKEGKVDERLAHIKGVKRRRRAYFLTREGTRLAGGVTGELKDGPVHYIDKDGKGQDLTFGKVVPRFKLDFGDMISMTDVFEEVRRSGTFNGRKASSVLRSRKGKVAEKVRRFIDLTDNAPRLSNFIGREDVITRIDDCIDGDGPPIIVIHGLAGIGKTSVALRLMEDHRGRRHILYHRLHGWDSLQTITSVLQELLERIGVRSKGVADMRSLDVNGLALFLTRELSAKPALLVFDDFHRAKEEIFPLLRLLTDLSTQFSGLRIVVVSRTVPGFYTRRDVTVNRSIEEVHLDGLDQDETKALLGEDYGDEAIERMHRLSRGVPLFIEILSSVDNVDAIGDIQRYVEEEIHSELEPGERKVLETLSVHRYPVPAEALLVEGTSFEDISALCRRSLVMELPHRRFEAHDLVKEFVYGRMSVDERKACHRRAAEFYGSVPAPRGPIDEMYYSQELALLEAVHHMVGAGDLKGAASLLLRIGPDMLRQGHTEVKEMLSSFHEEDVDPLTWADILLQKGDVAAKEEDWHQALGLYGSALEAKMELGADKGTLATIHGMIGRIQMQVESWKETITSHQDAVRMFEEEGDDRGMAKELMNLGRVHRNRRDWKKAEASYREARKILERIRDSSGLTVLHNNMALLKKAQGDLRKAEDHITKALEHAEEGNDELGRAIVLFTRGEMKVGMGRMEEARKDLEEAAETFRRKNEFGSAIRTYLELGDALFEDDRSTMATKAYLKALDLYQFMRGSGRSFFRRRKRTEDHDLLGSIYDRLSSVAKAKGDMKEALMYDEKALDSFEAHGDMSLLARKLLDMGLAHEDMGRPREAWTHMERALDRLSGTKDLKGMAVIRFNLARICDALGKRDRTVKHLEQARALAKRLGDKGLGSMIDKELKKVGRKVPVNRKGGSRKKDRKRKG